jgi:quinol monooxygenase YgiN
MADEQIAVLAKIKAKPGKVEEFKAELIGLIEPSLAEPGCVKFELHVSDEDESQFMFYEIWKSKEDLAKHSETPHLKAILAKMDELSVNDMAEVSIWKLV